MTPMVAWVISIAHSQSTMYNSTLCRIDENFVIKVADFGLSEDIYCKDYFRQALSGNTPEEGIIKLPIKWMALESLLDGIFTEKTDVVRCSVLSRAFGGEGTCPPKSYFSPPPLKFSFQGKGITNP